MLWLSQVSWLISWLNARSNCIIFAVLLYRRRGGVGHFRVRRSRFGHFPHIMYGEKRHVVHFVPNNPRHKLLPPPVFLGHVKWGDPGPP